MQLAGFEPAVKAVGQLQACALDHKATGSIIIIIIIIIIIVVVVVIVMFLSSGVTLSI